MSGLMFHAPTESFVISRDALQHAAFSIRHAVKLARELGGFPLDPHQRPGAMTKACHLEMTLIHLAGEIGIDLGHSRIGQIDLRDSP